MVHTFEVFFRFQAGFAASFLCALCFIPMIWQKLPPVPCCFKAHALFSFLVCMMQTEAPESESLGDVTLLLFNFSLIATLYEMAEHRRPSSIYLIHLIFHSYLIGFIFVSFFNPSTEWGTFVSKAAVPMFTTVQGYFFQEDFMCVSVMSHSIFLLWVLGYVPEEKPRELDLICVMGNFANLLVACKYLWKKIVTFQNNETATRNVRNEPETRTRNVRNEPSPSNSGAAEIPSMNESPRTVSASLSRDFPSIETSLSHRTDTSSEVSSTPSRFEFSIPSNASLSVTPLDIAFIESTVPYKRVFRTTSDSITISRSPFFETRLRSFHLKNRQRFNCGKRSHLHDGVVLYE